MWEVDRPRPKSGDSIHVDLGCGFLPRNPFNCSRLIAIDVLDPTEETRDFEYIKHDLTKSLPFESNSIDSISAYDFLEHIPRWERVGETVTFPFVALMDEIYRVLKPGSGILFAVTPLFPSEASFSDPTHVNYVTSETVYYFANSSHAKSLGYGFKGEFEIIFSRALRGAGPYDDKYSLLETIFSKPYSIEAVVAVLKVMKRLMKRIFVRKPTHILWVLLKN